MIQDEIKRKYLKRIKLIQKYNQFYYDKNKSIITDHEFDSLKREILELEKKYNYLKNKNSPSKNVGYTPFKKF